MNRLIRSLLATATLASVLLMPALPVRAVDDSALPVPDADLMESIPVTISGGAVGASVSPASLIFTDVDTEGGVVRIGNPSDQLLAVTVRARDYTVDAKGEVAVDEYGEPTTGIPNYQYASADWYTFQYTEFLLPAGKVINLPFTLKTPEAAAPGDHIAALIVRARRANLNPNNENSAILVTSYRFLVRLQHRVAGAEIKEPQVKVAAVVDGSRRIDLIATVDNLGTTVLDYKPYSEADPLPYFRIKPKGSDEVVREIPIPRGFYVLPEGNRIISVAWRNEDVAEPTGSDAEIARLTADRDAAVDLDQINLVEAKLRLATARKELTAILAKADQATNEAANELKTSLGGWYASQRAEADTELAKALIDAEISTQLRTAAQKYGLTLDVLGPVADVVGTEVVAAAELHAIADLISLPYTGTYTVEFVLPKRGGLEEIVTTGEFEFVNADPTKVLPSSSAPFLLIGVALAAGVLALGGVTLVMRRRSSELNAD